MIEERDDRNAFVIFAQAFGHFSIFGQRRDNVYDNGTRGKHGNCLGERNECRVLGKLKLQGEEKRGEVSSRLNKLNWRRLPVKNNLQT